MAKKYEVGCQHDNCDTCPYPDCVATAHQANTGKCGSKSIPSSTDIRLPREYKPEKSPPKPKALIKSALTGFVPYDGKVIEPETADEAKKRKKHEYYLKSKEKKAKMQENDKNSENNSQNSENKCKNSEKAGQKSAKTEIVTVNAARVCSTCVHADVCKYAETTKQFSLELPVNLRLECVFFSGIR